MKPELPAGFTPEALAQLAAALPELIAASRPTHLPLPSETDGTELERAAPVGAEPDRAGVHASLAAEMPDPRTIAAAATSAATNASAATHAATDPTNPAAPITKAGRLLSGSLPLALMQSLAGIVTPVDVMKSLSRLEPQMAAMDREIDRMVTSPVKLIADISSHTLGAGGKRLRPALVFASAQLCGDDATRADPRVTTCAAAVELIHTTSLIHDDVVDSATVRRGKPAANLIWGNETSVLVGDYLFAQVFVAVAREGFHDLLAPIANATSQLCAGELLETQTRGLLSMKEKQYCDIIALKTAALTECACRLGAMALSAEEARIEALAHYGREIGMAFQVVDDIFDIVSSEERLGKPVGNDIREGDVTLPMLRAAAVCAPAERDELAAILGKDPIADDEVQRALDIIRSTDAVQHCAEVAAGYVVSAKAHLASFPDGPAKSMLHDIADYVLTREK